ncbi:MAG: hypothetical protein Q9181_008226, partial [Wetmoreana brouardii]
TKSVLPEDFSLESTIDDQRKRSGQSSPSNCQLPSVSSLSNNFGQTPNITQAHRSSVHETAPYDGNQALRQQVRVLQAEKDQIYSLYEQLQIKSGLADQELVVLNEERAELRKQATELATQIDKLTTEREQLQHQSQADAAQWRQIMSMSSRLQMQSVEETRRFNADREAWSRERIMLEHRLSSLQGGALQRIDTGESLGVSSELRRSLTLSSMSDDQLRQEVSSLRERCAELEDLLCSVVKESPSIERAGNVLREVRKRIIVTPGGMSGDNISNQGNHEL